MRQKITKLISLGLAISVLLSTACVAIPKQVYAKSNSVISNDGELDSTRNYVYETYVKSISSRKKELQSGKIKIGNYTMTFKAEIIGEPEGDGYPIYFGLHGGGNENVSAQKEQYEIMQDYYNNSITSGIYIVPLAIEARYDEHYLPESFLFYDRLIEDAVIFNNGDPNRVYMLGFSSGGDGVYAISPLIADKLAAVNMSAGFPHVQKLENMYNLPICLQVGENDSAYDRNIIVAEYDSWLNELNKKYKGGFEHTVYIHKDGTHNSWCDVTDSLQPVVDKKSISEWLKSGGKGNKVKYTNAYTDAVMWVSQYERNPIPKRVVWSTNTNVGTRESKAFYWLDRDGILDNTTIVASYNDATNTVTIEQCDAKEGTLKVYLNSYMVDLFSEVKVVVGGKTFKVKPIVTSDIMKATLAARGDINYMFDAQINITLADNKNNIKVEAVSTAENDYEPEGVDNLVKWNSEDLFLVNSSLFGITYDQLCKKLGVKLPKTEKWPYWGNNLYWTSLDMDNNHTVVFMFQDNKTAIIYSEMDGVIKNSVKKSAADVFGARRVINGFPTTESETGILIMESCSHFYLENNVYDGKDHMVQKYVYYKYKD